MDDQEELKRKVEDFRQQMFAKASTDPEEIERFWVKLKAEADPTPYRLEFFFDPQDKLVLLQGNQAGLQQLLNMITLLARPEEVAGAHSHFDSATNFTENDLSLIIQRVNDDGTGGAHALARQTSQSVKP